MRCWVDTISRGPCGQASRARHAIAPAPRPRRSSSPHSHAHPVRACEPTTPARPRPRGPSPRRARHARPPRTTPPSRVPQSIPRYCIRASFESRFYRSADSSREARRHLRANHLASEKAPGRPTLALPRAIRARTRDRLCSRGAADARIHVTEHDQRDVSSDEYSAAHASWIVRSQPPELRAWDPAVSLREAVTAS